MTLPLHKSTDVLNNQGIDPCARHIGLDHRLAVYHKSSIEIVAPADISYLEASNNYCIIHLTNNRRIVASKCMKHILKKLNPLHFIKIHRKYAINSNEISKVDYSNSSVLLYSGAQVSISRSQKKVVKTYITAKEKSSIVLV